MDCRIIRSAPAFEDLDAIVLIRHGVQEPPLF